MKNILIVGGNGFIGRNMKEYFEKKHNVLAPSKSELNCLDLTSVKNYITAHQFDIVLNALDSTIDPSVPNSEYRYVVQRLQMFSNLAYCHQHYDKMLYFGTGAEYGRSLPISNIREQDCFRTIPDDYYGFLMNSMFKLALQHDNIYNFRLFGIFGKYENIQRRFISHAIQCALSNTAITIQQNTVFDYLHIDDLCKMVSHFVENTMQYKDYNATSGTKISLQDIAVIVKEITETHMPIKFQNYGFNKEYTACNKRIISETALSIAPITTGIKKQILWLSSL